MARTQGHAGRMKRKARQQTPRGSAVAALATTAKADGFESSRSLTWWDRAGQAMSPSEREHVVFESLGVSPQDKTLVGRVKWAEAHLDLTPGSPVFGHGLWSLVESQGAAESAFRWWNKERVALLRRTSRARNVGNVAGTPDATELNSYLQKAGPSAFRSPSFLDLVSKLWGEGQADITFGGRSHTGAAQRRRAREFEKAQAMSGYVQSWKRIIEKAARLTERVEIDAASIRNALREAGIYWSYPSADLAELLAAYRSQRPAGAKLPFEQIAVEFYLLWVENAVIPVKGEVDGPAKKALQKMRNDLRRGPGVVQKSRS